MKKLKKGRYFKFAVMCCCIILIGIAAYFLLYHASSIISFFKRVVNILMPFVWGFAIAYILSPLCNRFERLFNKAFQKKKKLAAALSITLSLVIALLIVVVLIILVIPSLIKSIINIAADLPSQITSASSVFHDFLERYPQAQSVWDEISAKALEYINSLLSGDLLSSAQNLLSGVGTAAASVFRFFKNIFFGILISVYMLASRRKFARQGKLLLNGLFPEKWANIILEEVRYADKMFNGFFVGRIIDSAIIGVICFVFTAICRFESAVLVSVIIGVTNIIPVFGPYIGAIPCALLLLLENPLHCLIFLIFIVILQIIDGNLIGPHILGQTTGVSSFWVLFSIMLFGGLWGILGMIIGVPLFAVIYDIIRKLIYKGIEKHKAAASKSAGRKNVSEAGCFPESFGLISSGSEAFLYTLENKNGMKISLTDLGATLVSVYVKDKSGELRDVVLGYDSAAEYENGELFLGTIVGRCANRTKNASLTISGRNFQLEKNAGEHNLHSGPDTYSTRLWSVTDVSVNSVTFTLESPDGDQGFPGNAKISVTYALTDSDEIIIDYAASADEDTLFNLTNHSYFNLNGCRGRAKEPISDVLDHSVQIFADRFCETDADSIPTGKLTDVSGTPMDLRKPKRIGDDIDSGYYQLSMANGYDHNWEIIGEGFRKAACFHSEDSGLTLSVFTDLPGIQFYSSNYIDDEKGKGGAIYPRRCAACFETQYFPDAANNPSFKSPIIERGEVLKTRTVFKFTV